MPRLLTPGSRLQNFYVGVSDEDPNLVDPSLMMYNICEYFQGIGANGQIFHMTCPPPNDHGRYVIVHMPVSPEGILSLCEVEVHGGKV